MDLEGFSAFTAVNGVFGTCFIDGVELGYGSRVNDAFAWFRRRERALGETSFRPTIRVSQFEAWVIDRAETERMFFDAEPNAFF